MAPIDPHSYTDSTHPLTTHISLSFYFDFPSSTILSSALLSLSAPHSGPFTLDSRSLSISAVIDPATLTPLPFTLQPTSPDAVLGQSLTVTLSNHSQLLVIFKTAPSSSALQWLSPPQTFNKSFPFVYTQCHSIHARSIFPCQDTPAARIKYAAKLNIPLYLSAVMAAKHINRRDPLSGECQGSCDDSLWCGEGRIVEEFVMEQPVPPYLFAFAIGELGFREVGPRTKVYSEAVPGVLDAAAREFAGTEEMIQVGEGLFGPYEWETFDLLVLPPSFPYAGMENPRMVFLTPTVIKGDATGARVVAHELAHSWTGNLITNKTNDHFWLNEGFTTYADRRIVEAVQGKERAILNIGIGWRGLVEEMERFKDNMEFTKLKTNQEGVDPDDVYSRVPYEKGFQFLWRIERQIGRPAFDEFLKMYIATFKFQSIDTDMFLDFLKANVPGIEDHIDLKVWTEGTGIPPDAMEPASDIYTKIVSLANEFKVGRMPNEDEVADWGGQEWELYLENLPKSVDASQVSALDERYRLSESKDYEVKVAFLQLAVSSRCSNYYNEVEKTLKEVGRMKYLRSLYKALVQGTGKEEEKIFAKRVFSEACACYHPIAQGVVVAILAKHIKYFAIYAETCFSSFGDRVKNWITINEPLQTAVNGYCTGVYAPGRREHSSSEPYLVAHHQLLAHAEAVSIYNKKYKDTQGGQIGLVVDCEWSEALSDRVEDRNAATRRLDFQLGWYLDPIFYGDYPETMHEKLGDCLPKFSERDKELLKNSVDFIGLNHYTTRFVRHATNDLEVNDFYRVQEAERIAEWEGGEMIGEKAASSWLYMVPWGLWKVLNYISVRYNNPQIYITENGMDDEDDFTSPLHEMLDDKLRVSYYKGYLAAVHQAIKDGADVRGYFAWSFLDNFEWHLGYTKRFGLIYVDYKNGLTRHLKSSAYWFLRFLKAEGDKI